MSLKRCRGQCSRDLEADPKNFSRDPSKAGGLRNVCRTCDADRRKKARGSQADHAQPAVSGGLAAGPNLAAFDADADLERIENATESTVEEVDQQAAELGVALSDEMTPGEKWRAVRQAAKEKREQLARERRRNSDYAPLNVDDFDDEYATGIANVDTPNARRTAADAAREKRQEFNEKMGRFATDLRDAAATAHTRGTVADGIPAEHSRYIRDLAEQERRFGNRRVARSISIKEAHEQLSREAMIYVAETYFKEKVEPSGYARFPRPETPAKRTACVLLSDLHLGSELDSLDEPYPFKAVEEARRLEWILRQFIDFKPQYRDTTEALIIINGDIIEGLLLHDLRSGAPLTEQQAIFWKYFTAFIAYVAMAYKSVRVVCQPGNHGRNKLRHPGRATSSKWDSVEWAMYYALKMMCSDLKNVTWEIPHQAISIVDLHGQILGVTHADTELKLGHPDTKAKENFAQLSKINSTNFYRVHFDGFAFGHYHTARYQPGEPGILWNGALVPPNGHARTSGYGIGEVCGQWIWEATEDHLFGDLRLIKVGPAQDNDSRLGELIKPFRFAMTEL